MRRRTTSLGSCGVVENQVEGNYKEGGKEQAQDAQFPASFLVLGQVLKEMGYKK